MYLRRVQCRLMLLMKLFNRVLRFYHLCNWWSNLLRCDAASLDKWCLALRGNLSLSSSRFARSVELLPWNLAVEGNTFLRNVRRTYQATQRYIQKTGFFNLTLHAFVESWLTINAAYSLRLRMSYSSLVYTPPFNLMTFMFHLNLRISSYITAAYIWLVFKGSFTRTVYHWELT